MTKKKFKVSKFSTPSKLSDILDDGGRMLNSEVVDKLNSQDIQISHLLMKSHCQDQEIQRLLRKIEELKCQS